MKRITLYLSLCLVLLWGCATTPPLGPQQGPTYSEAHIDFKGWDRTPQCCEVKGSKLAISSGGRDASKIGLEIANAGGNIIDVAVAVAFALAVERPHSAGLGGGALMTISLKEPKPVTLFVDFRETAPGQSTKTMFLDESGNELPGYSKQGAFAVGTPGFVAGLVEIHEKWGKLPWKQLVRPAIRLARRGFKVYPSLATRISNEAENFASHPYARSLFFRRGKPLAEGQLLVQSDLARTLTKISLKKKAGFYEGSVANRIVRTIASLGGILNQKDLDAYQVKYRKPIRLQWKGYEVVTAPPPSAGGIIMAQMLKILEPMDIERLKSSSASYVHVLSEAMKRAYADRSVHVGDPDFHKVPVEQLLEDGYISDLRSSLNFNRSTPSQDVRPGVFREETHGTTHLSIIDNQGNSVACTLTINGAFGSGIVVPGTGIILNNEMDDFSIKPGVKNLYGLTGSDANSVQPNKRPVSSMTPTVVLQNGVPVLALGGAGGSRIISNVFQVMINYMSIFPGALKKSLFAPRMHHQWLPDQLDLEKGYSAATLQWLQDRQHVIRPPAWLARVSAVARNKNELVAVFDPRDEGGVAAE